MHQNVSADDLTVYIEAVRILLRGVDTNEVETQSIYSLAWLTYIICGISMDAMNLNHVELKFSTP